MSLNDTMFKQPLAITPKAVIFDLDDTLYPERQYVYSGFQAVSDHVQRIFGKTIYQDLINCYQSGERSNVFGATLALHFNEVDDAILRKLAHIFWAHVPQLQMHEDARIGLALLFSRNIKAGLITTGPGSIQRRKVHALDLEPLLDGIIYTDDLLGDKEPGQPCEDAFHIIGLQLDVEFNEICFVGDNPLTDFVIPRRLGIKTVRIRRPNSEYYAEKPPSIGFQADRVIASLIELPTLFSTSPHPL